MITTRFYCFALCSLLTYALSAQHPMALTQGNLPSLSSPYTQPKSVRESKDFWSTLLGIEYLISLQSDLMEIERTEGIHRYTNIELFTQVGRLSSGYGLWNTRAQFNWGVFSGQIRFNQGFGQPPSVDSRFPQSQFASLDIQYIQFNLLPFRHWNVRMGVGNMHDFATGENHGEATFAGDVFLNRFRLNGEYRTAYDSDRNIAARKEWNLSIYYRLGKTYKRQNFHLCVIGKLFNYPQNAPIWMLTGGINLRLE